MISTHIRAEGLYVKTTIIYQLKWRPRLCIHGKHVYKWHPHKSVWYISHAEHFISNQKTRGCMIETWMPSANLVANSGNTIYRVSVIVKWIHRNKLQWSFLLKHKCFKMFTILFRLVFTHWGWYKISNYGFVPNRWQAIIPTNGGLVYWCIYRQVSNIRRTLIGNWIVDHSDVVGASPVGAAPTTSSFST